MSNDKSWKKAFSSAIVALSATLAPPPAYQYPVQSRRALRPFLPYCLHESGGDNFIWVNRDYIPLGISTDEWVDYGEYPWLHVGKDEPVAMRGRFWLFGDYNPPWHSKKNAARLAGLMDLLLDPSLNLRDTGGQAFRMLTERVCTNGWPYHALDRWS